MKKLAVTTAALLLVLAFVPMVFECLCDQGPVYAETIRTAETDAQPSPANIALILTVSALSAGFMIVNRKAAGRLYSKSLGGNIVIYPGDAGPGNEYFVNSAASNASDSNTGLSWENPLGTLDAAVNKCTADNGDKIFVAQTHAEDLDADSAVDIDVDGVTVVGVRVGGLMPTFTGTAAAGDLKLAGDRVTLMNCRFVGGIDAMTGIIEVSGEDCSLFSFETMDSTGQMTDCIVTDNAVRLTIDGWRHIGALADGADTALMLDECDHAVIRNFHIIGNFDLGAIECRTTASDDILITDGYVKTAGSEDLIVLDTITGSTGFVDRITAQLKDNAANITEAFTGATFVYGNELYVVNLAGERAMQSNITASTDA